MKDNFNQHSSIWTNFSYFSFLVAATMSFGGVFFLPLGIWIKAYMAMAILMLVQTTVSLTKTLRDNAEAEKLLRKVEDAQTEKLLLDLNRPETA